MSTPLIKEFTYDAPIESVWHALTDANAMRKWYFPPLLAFEPVVGYQFRFDTAQDIYQKQWIVTDVVAKRRLAHSWAYKGYPGSSETSFDLLPDGEMTMLRVTQTDLESFPDDAHFRRERFDRGWDDILRSNLKQLLEDKHGS